MRKGGQQRVCIIQPVMKAYRVRFFEQLATALATEGIGLKVVYGRPWPEEAKRGDNVTLSGPLGEEVPTWQLGTKGFFQPSLRPWLSADLVIIEHANKHLLSWLLLLLHELRLKRVAFWGHGRDSKADPDSGGERIKRRTLHMVDWWFAYSRQAAAYVATQGFRADRITAVENAIDTQGLRQQLASVTPAEQETVRARLGMCATDKVAVYCGSLYANKRLDLLCESADVVHARLPEFRLLVIGGGPMLDEIQHWARPRAWVQALGPMFGRDKALHLTLGSIWLNPGALGLAVLDGFVAGLPMITTQHVGHGPEIEYLTPGINGLVLEQDVAAYADGVVELLTDPQRLLLMQQAALADGHRYSIETMVANFASGVVQCLRAS